MAQRLHKGQDRLCRATGRAVEPHETDRRQSRLRCRVSLAAVVGQTLRGRGIASPGLLGQDAGLLGTIELNDSSELKVDGRIFDGE